MEIMRNAPKACADNREVMLTAVQAYGLALRFGSDAIRSDHEIVLCAVTHLVSADRVIGV